MADEIDDQLVSEFYQIDEVDLEEISLKNEYWESVLVFFEKVKKWKVSSLSPKRKNWLEKIEADLKQEFGYDD